MKTKILRLCFAPTVFLLFFFLFADSVKACSCYSSGAPCQAFWNTDAVFSGEVSEIIEAAAITSPDGRKYYSSAAPKTIRINIIEAFRGISRNQKGIEIFTASSSASCGYDFIKGEKYMIYAYKNKDTGKLSVSLCSRTRHLSRAQEDLDYFGSLATAKSGATIYGKIFETFPTKSFRITPTGGTEINRRNPEPLANIPVSVEKDGKTFETATDEKGEYRFTDLTEGEYKVNIKAPSNMWSYDKPGTVKVFDKGCAAYGFGFQKKTFLSGKLLNEKGEPLPKTRVDLIPVEQLNITAIKDTQFAFTDENGEYLFRSIPDGKYYLGVRFSGMYEPNFLYPQTFYPGTLKQNKAKIIIINEGDILENYDFKLPKKLEMRRVEGRITFPDGTPASKASISINETEYFYSYSFTGAGVTNADGTFSFEVPSGIRYLVHPVANANGQQRHAEPLEIPAKGNVKNLNFVITEPNGTCKKCLNWKRP